MKKYLVGIVAGLLVGYAVCTAAAVISDYRFVKHYEQCGKESTNQAAFIRCVYSWEPGISYYVGHWRPNTACGFASEDSKWVFCQ